MIVSSSGCYELHTPKSIPDIPTLTFDQAVDYYAEFNLGEKIAKDKDASHVVVQHPHHARFEIVFSYSVP